MPPLPKVLPCRSNCYKVILEDCQVCTSVRPLFVISIVATDFSPSSRMLLSLRMRIFKLVFCFNASQINLVPASPIMLPARFSEMRVVLVTNMSAKAYTSMCQNNQECSQPCNLAFLSNCVTKLDAKWENCI
jgi:hypothetical protein